MIPLPGGGGNPAPIVQYPNGYVLRGTPGVGGAVPYNEGALARLLNRRRGSTFFTRRKKRLEDVQQMQQPMNDYEESAP